MLSLRMQCSTLHTYIGVYRWDLKIPGTRVSVMRVACSCDTTEETPASWQAAGVDVLPHANHIAIVYRASRLLLLLWA